MSKGGVMDTHRAAAIHAGLFQPTFIGRSEVLKAGAEFLFGSDLGL
jgi:hypothetical protein